MIEQYFHLNCLKKRLSTIILLICFASTAGAQLKLDSIHITVSQVAESMKQRYIDPAIGLKTSQVLIDQLKSGKFNQIKSGKELATQLTMFIRSIIDDRHLGVYYSNKDLEQLNGFASQLSEKQVKERFEAMKKDNFGIKKVDILPGNIGYIDFKYFGPLNYAGELIIRAMDTLSNTNALIIDLRRCSGSMSEDFNLMFPGYFLENAKWLSTMYFRAPKQPKQNWSYGFVPGKKYLNKPVYLLTSGSTFSGAEALAYCLQTLNRITVVGDITGGAANPVGSITLNKHFGINMPEANVINTITKTNWETVGVIPEIKVEARDALRTAHLAALDSIKKNHKDSWNENYTAIAVKLREELPISKTVEFQLSGYPNAKWVTIAGDFNYWGKHTNHLTKNKNGIWTIKLAVPKGKILYRFIVDNLSITDPDNIYSEGNSSVKYVD